MSVYWISFATQTPSQFFSQTELFHMAGYGSFPKEKQRSISYIFRNSGIEKRAIYLNPSSANAASVERASGSPQETPDELYAKYLAGIREIAPQVAREALTRANLKSSEVDLLVFASCTGYTCPGFSIELASLLGVPSDRPTTNILGMGCSALIPALERAWDYLSAHPGRRALVISAEICSSTYWIDHDFETATGNALFGDGAAAVILSSRKEDLLRKIQMNEPVAEVEGFKTLRDSQYIHDLGFTQKEGRLKVKLDRDIPEKVVPLVTQMVRILEVQNQSRVAFHPGGKRILDLLAKELSQESQNWDDAIRWSRTVLKNFGNMSSPTVAFVLEQSLLDRKIHPGEVGALITMGPGLSVEGMRMTWHY